MAQLSSALHAVYHAGLEINPDRPHNKLPYRGAWLWVGNEMIHLMELPNPDPLTNRPEVRCNKRLVSKQLTTRKLFLEISHRKALDPAAICSIVSCIIAPVPVLHPDLTSPSCKPSSPIYYGITRAVVPALRSAARAERSKHSSMSRHTLPFGHADARLQPRSCSCTSPPTSLTAHKCLLTSGHPSLAHLD